MKTRVRAINTESSRANYHKTGLNISRRDFLIASILTIALPFQTGCLFVLGRLFIGRGMVRGLARGVRHGGRSSLLTAGRGAALAMQFTRLARLSGQLNSKSSTTTNNIYGNLEILRENDRLRIALIKSDEDSVICSDPEGRPIMYSRVDGDHLFHTDFYGRDIGRTFINNSTRVDSITAVNSHYDIFDKLVARDEVNELEGIVNYFEGDKLIGSSSLLKTNGGGTVIADKVLEKTIEEFNNSEMMANPEIRNLLDQWLESRKNCMNTFNEEDCLKAKYDSLNYIESLF